MTAQAISARRSALAGARIAFVSIAGFGGVWRTWKIATSLEAAGAKVVVVGYETEVPSAFRDAGFEIAEVARDMPVEEPRPKPALPSIAPLLGALAPPAVPLPAAPPEMQPSSRNMRLIRALEDKAGTEWAFGPLQRAYAEQLAEYASTLRADYLELIHQWEAAAAGGVQVAREYEREITQLFEVAREDAAHQAATKRRWFQAESHAPLVDALVATGADAVVSVDLGALDTASAAADRLRCKLVYSANEFWAGFLHNPDSPAHPIDAHLALVTESRGAHRADLVIATSDTMGSRMQELFALRHTPLTLVNSPTERVAAPAQTHSPLRLVFAGGLSKDRNIDGLIKAVAELGGQVTLDIHGKDRTALTGDLQALVHQLGVEHLVTFHGEYSYPDIVGILKQYDVGVGTSLLSEENFEVTLPNKVFDSMCAGLALAMYDAPAIRELFDQAPCGVILDTTSPTTIAEGLRALAEDPALVDSLRNESVRSSLHYWWPAQGERAVQAFRDMLVSKTAGR